MSSFAFSSLGYVSVVLLLLPASAFSGGAHSAIVTHLAASTVGVVGGEPSQNPEVVAVGLNCSGNWVSNNTLITAAHCAPEDSIQIFESKTVIEKRDGKEVETH